MKSFKNLFKNKMRCAVSLLATFAILLSTVFLGVASDLLPIKVIGETNYVLKVAPNSPSMPFFGQWVALEKGKTYVFSNCYLPGTDLHQVVYLKNAENNYDVSDFTMGDVSDPELSMQGTKFTVPTTALTDSNGKAPVYVGIRGYSVNTPLYYCDFKLYDVDNSSVNLLSDADLSSGGVNLDKSIWKSPYNTAIKDTLSKVTLETAGGIDIFKKAVSSEPMALKLAPNTTGMPWFGQWVTLKKGKTYTFSYCYLPGTQLHPYVYYKHTDNIYDLSDITLDTKENDPLWSKQNTTFTVPDTAVGDENGNVQMWVGMRGYKSSKELYFCNFKLCDNANASVNIFKDPDLLENNTSINAEVWKTPGGNIKDTYSKVTLKSIGGESSFKIGVSSDAYVLKLESNTTGMPWFGQWVTLKKGKTYIFSNCYLPDTELNHRICLKRTDGNYDTSDVTIEETFDLDWSKKSSKFTVPDTATDDGSGNVQVYVGIRGYKADKPLYFYDFKLYDVDNQSVNLLKDADLSSSGSAIDKTVWKGPYDGSAVKDTYSKVTLATAGGIEAFKKAKAEEPMVLALAADSTGMPFFGQWVTLKKGKTYIYSNLYLPGTDMYPRVYYKRQDNNYDVSDINTQTVFDSDWSKHLTTFTVPADAPDDGSGNVLMWVGMRGYKMNKTLYYSSFKLCDKDAPDTNIFKDGDLLENASQINKEIWKTPSDNIKSVYSKVTLASVGGENVFKKEKASEPMVLRLEPDTLNMPFFGQWITLKKGKTYTLSNCFLPGTDVYHRIYYKHSTPEYDTSDVITETVYDSAYSRKNTTFTVPADAPDDGNGNVLMWVGMRGYKIDKPLYFYDFKLCEKENPDVNLLADGDLRGNGAQINNEVWKTPGDKVKEVYSKVTLASIGGEDVFKRTGDTGPKMMYYIRKNRGPNNETYGCFMVSFPEELRIKDQNYVLEFDVRSIKGLRLTNFRCSSIVPEMALDENNTISPASIDGYKYKFHLRFIEDKSKRLSIMIFVPEGAEGYISNFYMYEADKNFNKVSNRDVLNNAYADFSRYELGDTVDLYSWAGGCIGTDTGKLVSVPEHYFEIPPEVPVPTGAKMMSYASIWGNGTINIALPYTVQKGDLNGKNYIVSIDIRPTLGRDPSKFYTTGSRGELVQVYPEKVEGYTYTFNLKENYNFSLVLEYPINCEGYISNLKMIEADEDFKPLNSVNLATSFGKYGCFADTTLQQGMQWKGIEFNGGFSNTFIDTRSLAQQLKNGTLGDYHSTGGIWPIPANFFVAEVDETWAEQYESLISGYGRIVGTVKDASGNPITDCTVVLKSMQELTSPRKITPDKDGKFVLNKIPVDGYEVSIITKDGNEIMGDMFFFVENDEDVVTLSLVYDNDNDLSVASDKAKLSKKRYRRFIPAEDNVLMWVLIGVGALVVAGATVFVILFVKKKKSKKS